MRRIPPVGLIFGFLGSVFAGCVGGSAAESAPSGPESVEETGAGLRGLVVSDELFPVAEAQVVVKDGPSTFTDAAGRFELTNLHPGTQTLNVSAEGYEPATQEAEVPLEGFAEVQILLKGIPGKSPYFTTIIFEGFDACSISLVYSAGGYAPFGPVPCPFGQRKAVLKTEMGPDWRAGVHEMVWKTSEEMIFASSVSTSKRPGVASCTTSGSSHTWCPALTWGRSPIRIYARINDTAYAAKYAIDKKETWPEGNYTSYIFESYSGYFRTEINSTFYPACVIINNQFNVPPHWGCPFGVGTSLGIRFQFYHTTFYQQAPLRLEAFTALPDG